MDDDVQFADLSDAACMHQVSAAYLSFGSSVASLYVRYAE